MPRRAWIKAQGSWLRKIWRWAPKLRALAPHFSWPWALSHEPWAMSHETLTTNNRSINYSISNFQKYEMLLFSKTRSVLLSLHSSIMISWKVSKLLFSKLQKQIFELPNVQCLKRSKVRNFTFQFLELSKKSKLNFYKILDHPFPSFLDVRDSEISTNNMFENDLELFLYFPKEFGVSQISNEGSWGSVTFAKIQEIMNIWVFTTWIESWILQKWIWLVPLVEQNNAISILEKPI